MADLHFSFKRGSYGYEYDWEGYKLIDRAVEASRIGINACNVLAVEHARAHHPDYPPESMPGERFASREGEQTVNAITILQEAEVSYDGDRPWVHGEWGVEDRPVVQDPDIWSGRWEGMKPKFKSPKVGEVNGTTMERAMWLEFGTVRMEPRPFLYPAWDETKVRLGPIIAAVLAGMPATVPSHRGSFVSRGAGGRFAPLVIGKFLG